VRGRARAASGAQLAEGEETTQPARDAPVVKYAAIF
jgi:hypothetical protein